MIILQVYYILIDFYRQCVQLTYEVIGGEKNKQSKQKFLKNLRNINKRIRIL